MEDTLDVATFPKDTFEGHYTVLEASNGHEGIELALKYVPDLVISDLMMPKMDGLEFCHRLKTEEFTSHIPLILLTAKANVENKLAGLQIWVDDYLTKPFHAEEPIVRVYNLIQQRKKLRERYSRELSLQPSAIAVSSVDEKFLEKSLTLWKPIFPMMPLT